MMTISVELMSPEYIKWTWVPMIIMNYVYCLNSRASIIFRRLHPQVHYPK